MTETNTAELAAVKTAALTPLSIKDTVLAQFKEAEGVVLSLAERYRNVAYDVKTPKGMKDAIAARADLRDNGRLFLTRAETRIKGEVNELKRVMADEVERLVGIVRPVEEAIDQQIKAEEQRKAAEKAERERIEAERVAKHRANIDKLKSYVERAKGQPIEAIQKAIDVLAAFPIGAEYEEFEAEAQAARNSTVDALRAMVAAEQDRIAKEAEAARVAAELAAARAELEALRQQAEQRLQAERAQQQAESDRQAREAEAAAVPQVQAAINDALITGTGMVRMSTESVERIDPEAVRQVVVLEPSSTQASELTKPTQDAGNTPLIRGELGVVDGSVRIVANGATIKLGDINARLAPIQISADGLASLGFEPVSTERNAKHYRESDLRQICLAISNHMLEMADELPA